MGPTQERMPPLAGRCSFGEDAGCREEASCERTQFVGSLVESEDICKVIGLAAPQHLPLAKDLHEAPGMSLIVNRLGLFPDAGRTW